MPVPARWGWRTLARHDEQAHDLRARARMARHVSRGRDPRVANGGTHRANGAGMSKPIPAIQKHMTTSPHSIGIDQPLSRAHAFMREHKIRHLPVLSGGKLVGMLTDRDLHLVESLEGVDPEKVLVEDAMSSTVYSVTPEMPLDDVAATP